MKPRTHLFVAAETAFGEAVLGVRIAHELAARGDQIAVLASERLRVLTEGTPFRAILVPTGKHQGFDRIVAKAAADVRADSVVLLDTTLVYWLLMQQGTDATFLRTVGVPVLGLDVWNVRQTGLTWDVCGTTWQHSKHSLEVTRRLVPVPFAQPTGVPGLYDALPPPFAMDDDDREDLRADLGVGEGERLVLITSAMWQHAAQSHATGTRIATTLPSLAGELLGRAGPKVRVVHVGPEAYAMPTLGKRYTWLSPRTPARFAKLLLAADLLVSFNFSATTIVSAIMAGLPVLLGINSYEGAADAIASRLPELPSRAVRDWIARAAPVPPYRVWPLGLHGYLREVAEGNPYTTAIRTVEILEEGAFAKALQELLFDPRARASLRDAQATYRRQVAQLPKAADLVAEYLRP